MKTTKKWSKMLLAGMAAMLLAFGLVLIGCDDSSGGGGGGGGGADTALNGTWVDDDGTELKLNNGNFEISSYMKGTYTTSGSNITMTVTHIHGDAIGNPLESKWYTKAELKSSAIGAYLSDEDLNDMFVTQTGTYSVSGNTFTMTMGGETTTYTK